ncbi:LOW QUALITY PROTEIN: hypothetical protein MXB_2014, partial [Myxobolus squamalis]
MYLPNEAGSDSEELVCDRSAYEYYNEECLTVYLVSGSQYGNNVILGSITNIIPVDLDDDDEDETDFELPIARHISFYHPGGVNRIKVLQRKYSIQDVGYMVATWSDTGVVNVWNTTSFVQKLKSDCALTKRETTGSLRIQPSCSFECHKNEGYALDWSETVCG